MSVVSRRIFYVYDMTCQSCELKIEENIKKIYGVKNVRASYKNSEVIVEFDLSKTNEKEILGEFKKIGYSVSNKRNKNQNLRSDQSKKIDFVQLTCIVFIIFGIVIIINNLGLGNLANNFPVAKEGMGYMALFFLGMVTSVHCVAMCGGINISQCITTKSGETTGKYAKLKPSLLYNLGRVTSYTIVGVIVGAIGSVISFSGFMEGFVAIFAGVFMVIMGLNMMNIFPWLKRFNPRLPRFLGKINKNGHTPYVVGLLNGLMPCGPLQAMQLYALSTGDPIKGGLAMFFFSLGTTPLMFGLGAISSMLTKNFTKKMMMVSSVLVIVMGIGMLNTGLSLSGISTPQLSVNNSKNTLTAQIEDGVQNVTVNVSPRGYEPISVKPDIPVKLNLYVESERQLNSCNNAIRIPEYGIKKGLEVGDNIIEFTPNDTGKFTYSCWMGMIRSSITVTT